MVSLISLPVRVIISANETSFSATGPGVSRGKGIDVKKNLYILAVIAALCLVSTALADDTDRFLGKWSCHNVIVDGKTIVKEP